MQDKGKSKYGLEKIIKNYSSITEENVIEFIQKLKLHGAGFLETIKIIREMCGYSLIEIQKHMQESGVWNNELETTAEMEQEFMRIAAKDAENVVTDLDGNIISLTKSSKK
ncbi:hypothetical protein K6119_04090 [Paracrocinitomix mangrovi]|uniref:hypothetical protein n=1 Tax=Paracrocinitomix mangrovi TaxID=2862509 RepID=UPI001C8E67B6|nr:hypothetical protein [Paracrocinitomix mangrovi]UKN02693.1 hypothetical protein K6119_04090 [Paracrocinitomix mangrovi]